MVLKMFTALITIYKKVEGEVKICAIFAVICTMITQILPKLNRLTKQKLEQSCKTICTLPRSDSLQSARLYIVDI